jgi:hypothetical protein
LSRSPKIPARSRAFTRSTSLENVRVYGAASLPMRNPARTLQILFRQLTSRHRPSTRTYNYGIVGIQTAPIACATRSGRTNSTIPRVNGLAARKQTPADHFDPISQIGIAPAQRFAQLRKDHGIEQKHQKPGPRMRPSSPALFGDREYRARLVKTRFNCDGTAQPPYRPSQPQTLPR